MNGIEDENLRRLINNLVIELYKYQAESERKRIKERQAQGIEIAKKKENSKGDNLNSKKMIHVYNTLSIYFWMVVPIKKLKNKLELIAERLEGIDQDTTWQ